MQVNFPGSKSNQALEGSHLAIVTLRMLRRNVERRHGLPESTVDAGRVQGQGDGAATAERQHADPPLRRGRGALTGSTDIETSRIEVRGLLAFGGPPRRHGCTQRAKRVGWDPRRGPGIRSERISGSGGHPLGGSPTSPANRGSRIEGRGGVWTPLGAFGGSGWF